MIQATKRKQGLHLHQLEIKKSDLKQHKIWVLKVPVEFLQQVNFQNGLNWKDLHKWLVIEHPSIFYVMRDPKQINKKLKGQENVSSYLYSMEPIDIEEILYTITKWSDEKLHQFDFSRDYLFHWEESALSEIRENDGLYSIIPAYYHSKIAEEPLIIPGINGNNPLPFHYTISDEQRYSTCVSDLVWVNIKKEKSQYPMSYQIDVSLITKPFQNDDVLFVNIDCNIKRYIVTPLATSLQYGKEAKILISQESSYTHHACRSYVEIALKNKGGELEFVSPFDEQLVKEMDGKRIISYLENPLEEMKKKQKISYFAVYNHQYFRSWHKKIEQGIGLGERIAILDKVSEVLGHPAMPALVEKVDNRQSRNMYPVLLKEEKKPFIIEVWDGSEPEIFSQIPKEISLWDGDYTEKMPEEMNTMNKIQAWIQEPLGYKTEKEQYKHRAITVKKTDDFNKLADLLQEDINLSKSKSKLYFLIQENVTENEERLHRIKIFKKNKVVTVHFIYRNNQDIIEKLPESANSTTVRGLKIQRAEEITKYLEQFTKGHFLAIVNLPAYHECSSSKLRDPRDSIRKAFIQSGRLTQFINGDKGIEHKIIPSIQDIFQHLGVLPERMESLFDDKKVLFGFSQIGKDKKIIISKIQKNEIPLFRLLEERKWYTFIEMAKKINNKEYTQSKPFIAKQQNTEAYPAFESEMIAQFKDKHIYFIFDAALRHSGLGFLTNPNVSIAKEKPRHLHYIRYNETDDVPEATIYNDTGGISLGGGLYTDESKRIFYSVGQKTQTMYRGPLKNFRKEKTADEKMDKRQAKEIVVMYENNDEERVRIANLIYSLRNGAITFKQEVSEPLPLRLQKLLKKYEDPEENKGSFKNKKGIKDFLK